MKTWLAFTIILFIAFLAGWLWIAKRDGGTPVRLLAGVCTSAPSGGNNANQSSIPQPRFSNGNGGGNLDATSSPVDPLILVPEHKEHSQRSRADMTSPAKVALAKPETAVGGAALEVQSLLAVARAQNRLAEFGTDLAMRGSREDVMTLLRAIETCKDEEREGLARSLQALHSSEASAELQAFMVRHSNDPDVAVQARDALARMATSTDVVRLSQSVPSDPEQDHARAYLLDTLARVSNPETVSSLADVCLLSKDPATYRSAAVALGGIGSPEAVSSLVGVIEERAVTNLNDPLSQALLSVANKDARLLLADAFLNSTNPIVKYASAYALVAISNQSTRAAPPQETR